MSIDLTALFSKTARAVRPSAIREMAKHAAEPGAISFARGDPAPEIFPVEEFYEGTKVLLERGREILQYGNTAGYAPLADFLCGWLTPRMGRTITREQLLITSGSGQVCDLLVRATVDRGDSVIVEEPTFLGNTNSMRVAGANFITAPVDEHGMVLDGLPEKIEAVQSAGGKISFIYTIPTFHNPAGVTMSLERRRQLVAIAQKYGILIMEDDPYRFVRFEGDDLPSLYELDGGSGVISAGSFSKILAPGTRVGWCVGPEAIVRIMTTLKQSVDSSASVVSQALVAEYCRSGRLDAFLPKIVANYRRKRDLMEAALRKYLPADEAQWTCPSGGFFIWITTPRIKTDDLIKKCLERKVVFVPGEPFYPNGGGEHSFRLCFTFATPDQLDAGIRVIGEAIRELTPVTAQA